MTDAKNIDDMTYAEFDRKHSDPYARRQQSQFYFCPNEDRFSHVVRQVSAELKGEPAYFMGIVGGVDMAWNYIAALAPERSFLFDVSQKAIDYQGVRMEALRGVRALEDYYGNLLCMSDQEKELLRHVPDSEKMWEVTSDYEPDMMRFAECCRQTARNLGHEEMTDDFADVLVDMKFRKQAVHRSISYANRLISQRELAHSWMVGPNLARMVNQAEEGRIKACRQDLYNGFAGFAQDMIDAYGVKNLVVYLSNVPEISGKAKLQGIPHVITDNRTSSQRLAHIFQGSDEKVDRLWIIGSDHSKNRILGGKNVQPVWKKQQ